MLAGATRWDALTEGNSQDSLSRSEAPPPPSLSLLSVSLFLLLLLLWVQLESAWSTAATLPRVQVVEE